MPKIDQDSITSLILKSGVILSLFMITAGVVLIFVRGGGDGMTISQIANYYNPENPVTSKSLLPANFLNGLLHADGLYFISVGLWVLIFTPVTVLIDALVTFGHERNKLYTLLDAIVLFNLLIAIFVIPRYIG
jgi:uncharacterized membrane protein